MEVDTEAGKDGSNRGWEWLRTLNGLLVRVGRVEGTSRPNLISGSLVVSSRVCTHTHTQTIGWGGWRLGHGGGGSGILPCEGARGVGQDAGTEIGPACGGNRDQGGEDCQGGINTGGMISGESGRRLQNAAENLDVEHGSDYLDNLQFRIFSPQLYLNILFPWSNVILKSCNFSQKT